MRVVRGVVGDATSARGWVTCEVEVKGRVCVEGCESGDSSVCYGACEGGSQAHDTRGKGCETFQAVY